MSDERMKNLVKNEKYIASGFESSDEDEDGDDDEDIDDAQENPNAQIKEMKAKLSAAQNDGFEDADDDDDEDDSDFEDVAGEFQLYTSPLEMTDEL